MKNPASVCCQNRKISVNKEAHSIKIVGLHHNVCLGSELYSEGWVREQFADVVFYCRQSSTSTPISLKRNLRANRSM